MPPTPAPGSRVTDRQSKGSRTTTMWTRRNTTSGLFRESEGGYRPDRRDEADEQAEQAEEPGRA